MQHKAVLDLEINHDVSYNVVSGGLYDVPLEFGGLHEILILHCLLQLKLCDWRRSDHHVGLIRSYNMMKW